MSTRSETDDRPRKKKKKKSGGGIGSGMWIGIAVGGGSLAIILIVTGIVLATRPWERFEQQEVAKKQPEKFEPGKLGGNVVKNPKSTLGKARRLADEVVRDTQMRGLVALHRDYCEIVKNPNARTLEGFLESIRREPSSLVNAVKDKDYTINFRARLGTEDVVAYETEIYDDQTYYAVRGTGQFGYLRPDTLKAALGQ
jgi:hypothetical protein